MASRRSIRDAALLLLARREHSAAELRQKLLRRGFSEEEISELLAALAAEGLQSDRRFVESFTRHGLQRGWGPRKVRAELRARGIPASLIEEVWEEMAPDFEAVLRELYRRRFGETPPATPKERARRWRFLESRGFSAEQIRTVLGGP